MPAPTNRPTGAPCWVELTTSDMAASTRFYSELFGWDAEQGSQEEYAGYVSFSLGGRAVAGGMAVQDRDGPSDVWSVHLHTDDASATAASVTSHGGRVVAGPHPVPGMGVMLFVTDPSGAGIGAWQADPFPGLGLLDEPGSPVWFELHTRSYDRDVSFYRDAFGWQTESVSDSPEFRYTTLVSDTGQVAGIMDGSQWAPESPMAWDVYFEVEDCDEACARVVSLGGSVVVAAENTPYGRLAAVTDATGALLKLLTPPAGG